MLPGVGSTPPWRGAEAYRPVYRVLFIAGVTDRISGCHAGFEVAAYGAAIYPNLSDDANSQYVILPVASRVSSSLL